MSSPLNPNQRHHIWASCQYVDRLLEDLESVPTVASSGSPFAKYVDDLTPAQKRVLRDYCASIRAQMVQAMQRHGIEPGSTPASSRHAIRTALGLVDIAIEEMRPQYMSGYGAMADEAVPEPCRAWPTNCSRQVRRAGPGDGARSGGGLAIAARAARGGRIAERPAVQPRARAGNRAPRTRGIQAGARSYILDRVRGSAVRDCQVRPGEQRQVVAPELPDWRRHPAGRRDARHGRAARRRGAARWTSSRCTSRIARRSACRSHASRSS